MSRIRLLPAARRDIGAIRDHIAADHPPGAARVVAAILSRIEILGVLPQAGTARP